MSSPTTAFSADRTHRYTLWRCWCASGALLRYVMVIGLNPSTADEVLSDPTVDRCIAFAKTWGYGALCMTNLFAFRSRWPTKMRAAADPIGPENDDYLIEMFSGASLVVAAWGNGGLYRARGTAVCRLVETAGVQLHALRITKRGQPWHPLYLPATATPRPVVADGVGRVQFA